jgi:hypothetical protein
MPSTSAVGHQHDLVVPGLGQVEVLADAGAERGDERLDLVVGEDPVDPSLLDVEDLAADREDRLGMRVAPCTAEPPAESPSTMKTSEIEGSLLWQSLELAGQADAVEEPLAAVDSAPCGPAIRAAAAWIAFWMMSRPSRGWASSQWPNSSVMARWTKPLTSELPSLVLVCPSNCGSPSLTEMTAVEALADVVAGEVLVLVLELVLLREVVDQLGQRGAEALLVGAALVGVDVLA